ncbi:hypothetical protein [Caballeronia cordobensis]|uniref:hypothetical protein n=1 Tax=Caballeronia cordobensis TaxID=1353886 RepID=UPI00118506D5
MSIFFFLPYSDRHRLDAGYGHYVHVHNARKRRREYNSFVGWERVVQPAERRSSISFLRASIGCGGGLLTQLVGGVRGWFFCGTCFVVGLLALPLPGAGVTFFAAAKKVTKESSFLTARGHTQFGHACQPTAALA